MIGVAEDDLGARCPDTLRHHRLTVAAVPTGMKAGVSTVPCAVCRRPRRAAPSLAIRRKSRSSRGSPAAVTEAKPIFCRGGVVVGALRGLCTVEGDEHEQRRLRQVKFVISASMTWKSSPGL